MPPRTNRSAAAVPAELDQAPFEIDHVDVPVGILGDLDDVGDRFPPREFVGMVLVRTDEDHRALLGRYRGGQPEAVVEACRDSEAEDGDEPIDGAGRTRPGEDHRVLFGASDGTLG